MLTYRFAPQLSFEEVVLKGLASDGGLFIPEQIPSLPEDWQTKWRNYSFQELAFEIMSLYISPEEIPSADLKDIIKRSYATFRYVCYAMDLGFEGGVHVADGIVCLGRLMSRR